MKGKWLWICAAIVTCVALVLVFCWGLMPLLSPPQGLHNGTDVDLIRNRYPHHLVNPESVADTDGETEFRWIFAETKARLGIIFISWCVVTGILFLRARRTRLNYQIDSGNSRLDSDS